MDGEEVSPGESKRAVASSIPISAQIKTFACVIIAYSTIRLEAIQSAGPRRQQQQ